MGTLDPNTTYIYERANGIIYAQEIGKLNRIIVGYDNDHTAQQQRFINKWNEILRVSESDDILREMINQIEVYDSLKKNTP